MNTAREQETFADAEPYRTGHRAIPSYVFPFVGLDPTPGGANLGCIEWHVEIHPAPKSRGFRARRRLREVWVWASQTRDERYAGKLFRFETNAEQLGHYRHNGRAFQPWKVQFCERHRGAVVLTAYPEDHHTRLIVEPSSSIMCSIYFAP